MASVLHDCGSNGFHAYMQPNLTAHECKLVMVNPMQ